jgi:UDP-glucose 4-epimerase
MKILVTGGAGYIGSFMVKKLLDRGDEVVVADSLERGYRKVLDSRSKFRQGDLLDKAFVEELFTEKYDCVMHFAAYIAVEESTQKPKMYLENNILTTVNLLDQMVKNNISNFIFSSTGTVYGTPKQLPIPESHPKNPENPYAQSKLMVEQILHWYNKVHNTGYAILRYFNAAGGALDGTLGENHNPETHLIPNAIHSALNGSEFNLYGQDYDTRDKTAIRDYIHVLDLVDAHLLTLKKLKEQNGEYIYNVGTGRGSTNKEVIEMVKKVSGRDFPVSIKPRRAGDVAETVADISKIQKELSFSPKYSDLETIVSSAFKWHKKLVKS